MLFLEDLSYDESDSAEHEMRKLVRPTPLRYILIHKGKNLVKEREREILREVDRAEAKRFATRKKRLDTRGFD